MGSTPDRSRNGAPLKPAALVSRRVIGVPLSITRMLDRLERKGLIVRSQEGQDRRHTKGREYDQKGQLL
ncbi:MarR family transcriptional regulator [Pseudomonas sp. TH10]|uniref:MarR family transcriptional regulator n=1 Tax=Pseudomonas sp. TH10 TaxID=2796376 RepID=UPI0027DAD426|nr:MarR family transcriptional regulator [Pseudomonas sp. TH10]